MVVADAFAGEELEKGEVEEHSSLIRPALQLR